MNYYEVAPNRIVRAESETFTYSSDQPIAIGSIVIIPIGKKDLTGVVVKQVDKPKYVTKPITSLVEDQPLPEPLIKTAIWMSQYYQTHLSAAIQTLLPTGVTKNRRPKKDSVPIKHSDELQSTDPTKDQSAAISTIKNTDNGTILLHGVTGSGKTFVYIEAAKQSLLENKSVIVLVPEIALTSQLVAEFTKHFPNTLVTHSQQTEAERHLVWKEALNSKEPRVVIGPRSALFMPLEKIGLIVVDECHEPSYKQEQSPRYSALRVASILAKEHAAKVVFGSATPAIADYFLAKTSHQPILTMPTPARKDTQPPLVKIVDMTKRDNFTSHPFLSNELLTALESTFENGKQALIFHNRRGTASTTLCSNCGWQAGCPRCFIPLTLHADSHQLRCHICAYASRVPTSCPECHHADILHKGLGTKRIEVELQKIFPKQNIARFDGDVSTKSGVDKRYDELRSGEIDLIIGTQVVAKGLDLPHLRTVGIVQADVGLDMPDFAAAERTFQLLAQAMGRVGRSHHQTTVIAQSFQPENPSIVDGLTQNYDDFYQRTIKLREHTNFPPFCHLLKLVCSYKTETTAVNNAKKLAEILKKQAPSGVEVLGPTPAFYERVRDNYRWQLVVKAKKRQDLVELLKYLPKTHWQFELDPTSLL